MLLRLEGQADGDYSYPCSTRRPAVPDPDAYGQVFALCSNSAERAYLQRRREEMRNFMGN